METGTWIHQLCRRRLMGYAESFEELSRSYMVHTKYQEEGAQDRPGLLAEQKMQENRQAMGDTLNACVRVMSRIAEEIGTCYPMEDKRKKLILRVLKGEGYGVGELYYLPQGEERRAIGMSLYTEKPGGKSAKSVADILSVIYKKQICLSVTSPVRVEHEEQWFVFEEETAYVALTGFARAVKEEENFSGDHYGIVESGKGIMTLILSDGTGSGEDAGENSGRVLDLLEKLMEAGYDTESAVRMVNTAYYTTEDEGNHPTLDVCELDLYKGICDISKVGGAATFIKHGVAVEKISEPTLPLGILQNVNLSRERRRLENGDYIIMMTDGVLDVLADYEETEVLTMNEMISGLTQVNSKDMAEALLQQILRLSGGRVRDDMTILVAGIWENSILT